LQPQPGLLAKSHTQQQNHQLAWQPRRYQQARRRGPADWDDDDIPLIKSQSDCQSGSLIEGRYWLVSYMQCLSGIGICNCQAPKVLSNPLLEKQVANINGINATKQNHSAKFGPLPPWLGIVNRQERLLSRAPEKL
jgi:hypothetical protein